MTHPRVRKIVAAFDFDGTISTRDTFLPFLFRVFGWSRVLRVLIPLTGDGLRVLLGRASRDAFKARLIERLFTGAPVSTITPHGLRHAEAVRRILRPQALERIEWHRAQGHRLVMVSASLELYLCYVAAYLRFDDLLCTQLGEEGACFDGRMAGGNCRGPEKVKRLEGLLGDLSELEIYAYGDSDGDREMLDIAQHPFYQPFRDKQTGTAGS
ncbi:HAD-IB family hydrolase [Thiorhodovibrio frisius]|uniref:HAD-superfamily subfamily IB hydrolase, TIGR01490 n=1 Tax=Thiorhodovibrio frisius TaxID=631362 RepID=H8Z2F3_9GAMM|nr:HAD-IB family hydrolase [Thiorhodovibrio frisius]EIC21608.1 HAD-superfamily subfamily IB hydrolase, TIGR01490 [Thiorhodovibrio frisius]WPL21574.1 HAD hydrolase, family IB [Thiorhodovibrio frisius]